MNATPDVPSLEKMNCSHAWHSAGLLAPARAGLPLKKFVLSCREYEFATIGPAPPFWPVSDATLAVSNEPTALEMVPLGACAEMSLPLPTIIGLGPTLGTCGYVGAGAQAVASPATFGYSVLKPPPDGRAGGETCACQSLSLSG